MASEPFLAHVVYRNPVGQQFKYIHGIHGPCAIPGPRGVQTPWDNSIYGVRAIQGPRGVQTPW